MPESLPPDNTPSPLATWLARLSYRVEVSDERVAQNEARIDEHSQQIAKLETKLEAKEEPWWQWLLTWINDHKAGTLLVLLLLIVLAAIVFSLAQSNAIQRLILNLLP